ncbi:GNAT family N-acetyltransferase [Sphingomonas cannabina]|uniref:GNAT family N-acetyltransferase n=1 Tax=Sphingomonas cannabina TaxID=2899123 RepID=UPI001F1FE8E7|nr:GNAT family N-acetyltransferase [Sphingomonas cannabina]UIJ44537.1 GNAT family N-acetyltransferase [Sphingomonas cannabina]
MQQLTIRPYQASDWPAINAIHDAARLDELRLSVGLHAFRPLAEVAEDEGLFDGELWVAEAPHVVGFVAFDREEVSWLYVDPAHYGKGVGKRLLRHALARIPGDATTSVLAGNDPALNLYLAAGFEIVETRSGHLSGAPDVPATGHLLKRGGRN